MAQNWLCVNAAAEGLKKRMEMMERWQHQEVQVKESGWAEEISQRWKQPKREDRAEMKKEAKLLRCREHRLRKEEMEEHFNKGAKEG